MKTKSIILASVLTLIILGGGGFYFFYLKPKLDKKAEAKRLGEADLISGAVSNTVPEFTELVAEPEVKIIGLGGLEVE